MGKKETLGSDPFAEFGGSAVQDDPFTEFGGAETPPTDPFVQAPPQGPPTASSTGAATSLPAGAPSGAQGGQQGMITAALPPLDQYGVAQTRDVADEVRQGLGLTQQQAQANIEKTAQNKRHYNEKFGPLGLDQVAQYREKVMPMELAAVKSMEQKFMADKQRAQASGDPALIDALDKQAKAIDDAYSSLQRDARMANQRELEIKSGIGSKTGATWNEYLGGQEDIVAGLNRSVLYGLIDATPLGLEEVWGVPAYTPRDQIKKEKVDKRIVGTIHGMLDPVSAKGTTSEYIDKMREDFLGGAWLGLARSAPGMATPYMTGIGFQTFEQTMQEMDGPEFSDMTQNQKATIALPIAAATMALERFGFKNLAREKSIVRGVAESGLRKLGLNASEEQVEAVMNKEAKDWASRYLAAAGTGGAAEFETGALQELATNGLKELANEMSGPSPEGDERFETPDGWREYLQSAAEAGAQEAVGGFIMAQPYAVSKALRSDGVGKMTTPKQFEVVEKLVKDPNYRAVFEQQQQEEIESGELTPEQAAEVKMDFDRAQTIIDKIPDDLPIASRQEAFDLLAQREALKKKDPALVATKVEAINEKLRALEGVPKTPEPTTNQDGTTTDPKSVQPTGEEVVQTSTLPDTQGIAEAVTQDSSQTFTPKGLTETIPASETIGLGPEPVLAAGATSVAPDAAPVTIQETDTPPRFEIPPQDASIGTTPETTRAIQGMAEGSAGTDVQQLAGTTEQRVDTGGQDSLGEVPVGNELVDEDQPTQQAAEATSSVAAPGVPDSPPPSRPAKPVRGEPKKRRRATAERLLKEYPELEEVLTDEAVHYERISNKTNFDTAKALVEATGYDAAAKAIIDGVPMPDRVRNMIGRIVTEHYRKEGNREKLRELTEEWFATITNAAQGLAAMHTLYGDLYDAETLFYKAERDVQQRRKAQDDTHRPKTERIAKGLRKINEEGAEEVIRTRRIRQKVSDVSEANPTERTTDPPSYGARNRVVTKSRYQEALKRMRGQMNSGVSPEMIIVAAYHIEAGSRSFAAVAERVAKRLGKKALPYLKGAYKEAFKQLKQDGVDVGEPTSDEEINEYISKELSPQALKDGLKALDLKIDDIIRKHWSEQEEVRRTLADKFIQDAGLGKEEAEALAKAVQSEFDKVTREKKEKLIRSLFSAKERVLKPRKIKGIEDDIILMSNIGAFKDADLIRRYGDAMGFAQMTEEDVQVIQGLAENIQKAKEGRPRLEAIQDLVAYQADMKGMSFGEVAQSVWYANMLSGFNTHLVNFFANLFQVASEFGIAATRTVATLQKPGQGNRRAGLRLLAKGLIQGGEKGWLEAGAAWRTGRAHLKDKIEAPAALERMGFKGGNLNPANYLKYVRRAMVAADVLGYETAKEMRAYQLAVKMANFDTDDPSMDLRQKALDILNRTDDRLNEAKEEAQQEYEQDVAFAKSERDKKAITEKEYQKALKTAERDRKRRVFELVETGRPDEVQKQSSDFGSRTTYNYKPEGLLGALTNGLNATIEQVPGLAYVIPFRNIIANVANEAINYTPWGFARAVSARGSVTGSLAPDKYKEALSPKMTPEQLQQHKLDLIAKASWGIVLTTVTFLLSDPGDDDDPTIEITANGYADWKKNMALKETGWQPYSFRFKGKWYSYQYTPLVLVFGFVGDYRDAQKYRGEKITDTDYSQFAAAMGRSMAAFMNMTWLTTADKVLKAFVNPSGERAVDDLMKEAQRIGKTFVVPAIFTQASREVQAMTETPQKDTKGTLLGEILKDIPVLRNDYEDAINALGEPIVPKTDRFISSVDPDPVWNLFADKAYALSTPHPNELTVMDGEKERVMTPKERHDYLVLRGQYIREKIEQYFSAFDKMDKEAFADEMRKLSGAASKRAKAFLVLEPTDPDVMKGPWFDR